AKTRWEFEFISNLERLGGFSGQAFLLNEYNTFLGNPDYFDADLARHRNATVESVRNAVAKYLNTSNSLRVRFQPETATGGGTQIDRSKQPEFSPDKPFQVPEIKRAKLENGLEVFAVGRPELPKIAVRFVTRAGSAADPTNKGGLANLSLITAKEGTKTNSALDIADSLAALGTSIDSEIDREYASLSFDTLKRNIAPAV